MIIYLHGFDSNSPGNHEKVLQLQFIDPDVRLISYSTRHPKHDMQHLLKEVDKMLQLNVDEAEIERRRALWQAPPIKYQTGVLAKYAKLVSSASRGAVTD